MDPED
jgi:hypothetical protein